jgi:REP element-mobilizing transposase RayT
MVLIAAGEMIRQTWNEIPSVYPGVEVDAFIVMPNHVHGIVVLPSLESDLYPDLTAVGALPCGCPSGPKTSPGVDTSCNANVPANNATPSEDSSAQQGHPQGGAPTGFADGDAAGGKQRLSMIDVVERLKSLTTKRYGDGVRNDRWPRYSGKLWQRGYYERVVRNEAELGKFRNYIETNPARWIEDPYRND